MKLLFLVIILLSAQGLKSAEPVKKSGMFVVAKGIVKLIHPDTKTEPAKVGTKVNVGDSVTTGDDSRAKIVMVDRNVLNITPNSNIKIENYESGNKKKVEINLVEGKMRADVEEKYDGKTSFFTIRTKTAQAGVRGTQFFMGFDRLTNKTEIVTFRGSVIFGKLGLPAKDSVLVSRGQTSNLDPVSLAPEAPTELPAEILKQFEIDSSVTSIEESHLEKKGTSSKNEKASGKETENESQNKFASKAEGTEQKDGPTSDSKPLTNPLKNMMNNIQEFVDSQNANPNLQMPIQIGNSNKGAAGMADLVSERSKTGKVIITPKK